MRVIVIPTSKVVVRIEKISIWKWPDMAQCLAYFPAPFDIFILSASVVPLTSMQMLGPSQLRIEFKFLNSAVPLETTKSEERGVPDSGSDSTIICVQDIRSLWTLVYLLIRWNIWSQMFLLFLKYCVLVISISWCASNKTTLDDLILKKKIFFFLLC